jgi:hypothetical protein
VKITIDLDELGGLVEEGEKIFLKPEAEQALLKILDLEEKIAEIKDLAKATLLQKANELNPNFKSLSSDEVRITCRAYGDRFYIEPENLDMASQELYKREVVIDAPDEEMINELQGNGYPIRKVVRKVDTKAVEKFVKANRGMPTGISEYPEDTRPKQLSFSRKGGKSE